MKKYKALFLGTPQFSVPILESLSTIEEIKIIAVITEPDKPTGRGQIVVEKAVKKWAKNNKIPVYQPETKEEILRILKQLKPDIGLLAAYGKILSKEALTIPRLGILNVHGSLLPKLRGATPIQYAILEGEKETGISLLLMDQEVDHGPILAQAKEKIKKEDTYQTLALRLSKIAAQLVKEVLPGYLAGKIKPKPQDHTKATVVYRLKKEDGEIDWSKGPKHIERQIRAFNPWPGTFTIIDGKRIIIHKAHLAAEGSPFGGNAKLVIDEIQLEGKKRMQTLEFKQGYQKFLSKFPSYVKI